MSRRWHIFIRLAERLEKMRSDIRFTARIERYFPAAYRLRRRLEMLQAVHQRWLALLDDHDFWSGKRDERSPYAGAMFREQPPRRPERFRNFCGVCGAAPEETCDAGLHS